MKAAICTKYGAPNMLQIKEVPKPEPKEDELLIRIYSSTVNSGDVRLRSMDATGFLKIVMQLFIGFSKPRKPILGTIYSGSVDQLGSKVSKFKVGDAVFGMTGFKFGTHAEYIVVNQKSNICSMPNHATFDEAAAIVFGGQTAIYYLHKAKIRAKSSPKVLILGATGSVGSSAIQVAQYYGAHVTAVCSSKGQHFVERLGVEHVMLYDKEDVAKHHETFDIIFDAVGKYSKKQFQHMLRNDGVFKSVSRGFAAETKEQLQLLKALFENGHIKACIDKVFQLEDIVEAHRYVETGRKKGNVVLRIQESN